MTRTPADALCRFVPPFMRYLRDGLAELNMSPARFQLLEALDSHGALTMIDLAERLSVTKRNVTSLVDGLEKEALAARGPHPSDRRATLVTLTAAGSAAFAQAAQVQRAHLEALLDTLEEQERAQMAGALGALTEALVTLRHATPKG